MSTVAGLRERLSSRPDRYWRAWLGSVNFVGLVVIGAVLFDVDWLLGSGQAGIYLRSAYPLVPPSATFGVALYEGRRRGLLLSGGVLVGYLLALVVGGVLPSVAANAPGFLLGYAVLCGFAAGAGFGWAVLAGTDAE